MSARLQSLVAPAVIGATIAQPCPSAWAAVMQRVERADATSDAAIERYNRACAAYEAITGENPSKIGTTIDPEVDRLTGRCGAGQLSDDAVDAYADATGAAILTPAPDHAALLWKIEHLGFTASYCEEWAEAVLSDARRLLSNGRA